MHILPDIHKDTSASLSNVHNLDDQNEYITIIWSNLHLLRDLSDNDIHQLQPDSFANYTQVKL